MDRRSWPWRKKRSSASNASSAATVDVSSRNLGDQVNSKSGENVKISKERFASLLASEDQVNALNNDIRILNEKLSSSQRDLSNKDNLVSQHAKVAEEAVTGWEKAEAEASALKGQLESVTLQKLAVEERAAHLDNALKECMKQVRNVKEEGEKKLHDVILEKTMLWEKMKFDLDFRITELDQSLSNASAENASLSRALQERSVALIKLSGEKSQAEEEIEVLKANIQSLEKEIVSLRYETQVLSKELEIRNEEKNMSQRSAEISGKQHIEDTKKIAKLEAECQRLRGLVRKKLPGAAAIAQMRQEVDDYSLVGSPRHISSSRHSTPRVKPHDFALENMQQCYKENELLVSRLMATEEEMKLLKEALSKRNNELQASRTLCAKTAAKLRQLESRSLSPDLDPSLTSISEDEEGSQSSYWAGSLTPDISLKKVTNSDPLKSTPLDLMDDFLEMEKLAYSSPEPADQALLSRVKTGLTSAIKSQEDNLDFRKLVGDIKIVLSYLQEFDQKELRVAVSHIHEFVSSIREKFSDFHQEDNDMSVDFTDCVTKVLSNELALESFVVTLSMVLNNTKNTIFHSLGDGRNEEVNGSVYVDKVALLESKAESNDSERFPSPDIFDQMKHERDAVQTALDQAKVKLHEMESKLTDSYKSNSLAETQLKCMAESYKALEARTRDLETEIDFLRQKIEILEQDLQKETLNLQNESARCRDLQEQLESYQKSTIFDTKSNQERDIAAAAEKLAECQETINLLGKHIKALQTDECSSDAVSVNTGEGNRGSIDLDGVPSFLRSASDESPVGGFNPLFSPPRSEAGGPVEKSPAHSKKSAHRPSSSFSSTGRSIGRFFSKGKNAHH